MTSASPAPTATTSSQARVGILTVDDDPSVSRAVARDLRRRYGKNYRIIRAESGQQALDALHEMKLRGDQVALLLADHRMPQMDGIQFLERAMDIYPEGPPGPAHRVRRHRGRHQAINVVDLDYYLLKPWDPPEEKFYPVIDNELDQWKRSDHTPPPQTKVVGHPLVGPVAARCKDFLARNQVPYRCVPVRRRRRVSGCSRRPA